jgi:hypothetical protein
MKPPRTLPLLLAMSLLAGCRSSPSAPPRPPFEAKTGTLPGGLLAHGVAHVGGASLLGATAGPLMGYLAVEKIDATGGPSQEVRDLFATASREADLKKAVDLFGRAIGLDDRVPGLWIDQGLCQLALGDRESAVKSFRRALAIDVTDRTARTNLDRLQTPGP